MTKRRVLGVLVVLLLAALVFASVDRCGDWPDAPPRLSNLVRGAGALRAGSAKVPITPPTPVTVGGPPLRMSATGGDEVSARATVIEVGGTQVGLVSLDLLFVTRPLVDAIRAGRPFPVVVTATHTHSSIGQFDRRLASQLAALGSFEPAVEAAIASSARAALDQAAAALTPSTLEVRDFDTASFVRARSGANADTRGLEVRFVTAAGPHTRWLLLAAHPTLAPRRGALLDTDWPGALDVTAGPVTLVLQTAVGNASIDKANVPTEAAVAEHLARALEGSSLRPACAETSLDLVSAHLTLPHPDGSRVAPGPLARPVENVLCAASEMDAEVTLVRLGCLSLLALPVEASAEAAQVLEGMTGATRVISLANGYLGYVEPDPVVRAGLGESKRQWFGPDLLERLGRAALLTRLETPR